ncbi:hypothetical protein L1987_60607 [Smallanthus sonchifolius]|uniref:Uncharacterized protein n=2 Tax=Smallanthus sonchifolius TaxID=185202 RepID=A0ACB9D8H0_9ASTR|nr:hypothetical protein L1987_60605 [Smallanthus sonchifolius]KAI3742909.1 hypothetical protein L1987_60607 [Smallanthus sonchifolius]
MGRKEKGETHYKTAASTQTLSHFIFLRKNTRERERERSACEENRKEKTQGLGNHPSPPFQRIATEIGPVEIVSDISEAQ